MTMSLRIRQNPYKTSNTPPKTYDVRPDEVRGHLLVIASGGSMDNLVEGFGEEADTNPDYLRITLVYDAPPDESTPKGQVQKRLLDIVNSQDQFEIVGVPEDTTWADNNTTSTEPAYTLGQTVYYAVSNCNGKGRKVAGASGDQPCTPVVGVLYHELAHAFHHHPSGDPFDPQVHAHDEAEAITDENVLRAAMNLEARSTTDLSSSCGCNGPGGSDSCCIIASVATGAPYGPEVTALRAARDHFLRASATGDAFFTELFSEYYSFSIEICRIMVGAAATRPIVERTFVRPLIAILHFLRLQGLDPGSANAMQAFEYGRRSVSDVGAERSRLLSLVRRLAEGLEPPPPLEEDPDLARIETILAARVPHLPHVRWAICGVLALLLEGNEAVGAAADPAEITAWWRGAIRSWLGDMPLIVPPGLDVPAWERDLDSLLRPMSADASDRADIIHRLRQRLSAS
jgi:hypothetical protein